MGDRQERMNLYLEDNVSPIPSSNFAATLPRTNKQNDVSRRTLPYVPTRTSSASSAASSNYCPSNVSSDKTSDSIGTSASSISSTPFDYGYHLPCEFSMVGCQVMFHATEFELWYSHSLSHFGDHPPPPKSICTFCDQPTFKSEGNPRKAWRKRMLHIEQHYRRFESHAQTRPDFWLVDYLRASNLIEAGEYKYLNRYTERPLCDGLVAGDFKTPERIVKEERDARRPYDLEKEERVRIRAKQKGKARV